MHASILEALAVVLAVSALATVLFQRLRLPAVLGYLVAGVIIGPHVVAPAWADPGTVATLSEIGIVLVFFSLGLDFSLRRLAGMGPKASLTAIVECSLMLVLGFSAARLLGWDTQTALFTAAIVTISSTTIVVHTFQEQRVSGTVRERVIGVLLVEDLIAILLITALTAQATGASLSGRDLALALLRLAAFVLGAVALGLWVVPAATRAVLRVGRSETTLVTAAGLCFVAALLAREAGYSAALGAFLAGSLIAESGREREIESLVRPLRDLFAAVFFVSVGMSIAPRMIMDHTAQIALLTALVVAGKIASVFVGVFLTGGGVRGAVQAGLSLAQIGEFAFLIAGVGQALGVTEPFLYSVAVAVSALSTLATPLLVKASQPAAAWIDRKLPHRIQTFATLYGSWVERLGQSDRRPSWGRSVRRLMLWLLVDAGIMLACVVAVSLAREHVARLFTERLGLSSKSADVAVLAAAALLAAPFALGAGRLTLRLGDVLSRSALPARGGGHSDLDAAPRRVLRVALELLIVLAVGTPLVALAQPLLPWPPGVLLFPLGIAVLGLVLWRRTAGLEGHVRASAEVVAEALLYPSRRTSRAVSPASGVDPLEQVRELFSGLGEIEVLHLAPSSRAVGRSLSELDLRGLTGASVIAIMREGRMVLPAARELLRAGDQLAFVGTRAAVDAARRLLDE